MLIYHSGFAVVFAEALEQTPFVDKPPSMIPSINFNSCPLTANQKIGISSVLLGILFRILSKQHIRTQPLRRIFSIAIGHSAGLIIIPQHFRREVNQLKPFIQYRYAVMLQIDLSGGGLNHHNTVSPLVV